MPHYVWDDFGQGGGVTRYSLVCMDCYERSLIQPFLSRTNEQYVLTAKASLPNREEQLHLQRAHESAKHGAGALDEQRSAKDVAPGIARHFNQHVMGGLKVQVSGTGRVLHLVCEHGAPIDAPKQILQVGSGASVAELMQAGAEHFVSCHQMRGHA